MISTIIIFILVLGVLVFVHELGHFVVAKKSGMKVLEFGFGFPPRLLGIQRTPPSPLFGKEGGTKGKWRVVLGHRSTTPSRQVGTPLFEKEGMEDETIYSINAIPFGGFVKILGEDNGAENDPRSFVNRPFWGRFFTLVAGVTMNVVLAWVLISIALANGVPSVLGSGSENPKGATVSDRRVAILEVQKNSPADIAGLRSSDIVLKVDSQNITTAGQLKDYIKSNIGNEFVFEVEREKQIFKYSIASRKETKENEGPTGVVLADVGTVDFEILPAFWQGAKATLYQIGAIANGFWGLFTKGFGWDSLGGPVQIARLTGQAASMGMVHLLQFTAFLSLNLAILNIIPFPALDGGRVLLLVIEKIRRKRNNQKIEQWINSVGFLFLVSLMILVTIKDIKGMF